MVCYTTVVRRARTAYRCTRELRLSCTVRYSHAVQSHTSEFDNFNIDYVPIRMSSLLFSEIMLIKSPGGFVELRSTLLPSQVTEDCVREVRDLSN